MDRQQSDTHGESATRRGRGRSLAGSRSGRQRDGRRATRKPQPQPKPAKTACACAMRTRQAKLYEGRTYLQIFFYIPLLLTVWGARTGGAVKTATVTAIGGRCREPAPGPPPHRASPPSAPGRRDGGGSAAARAAHRLRRSRLPRRSPPRLSRPLSRGPPSATCSCTPPRSRARRPPSRAGAAKRAAGSSTRASGARVERRARRRRHAPAARWACWARWAGTWASAA